MRITKLTTLFSILALTGSVAMAQPPAADGMPPKDGPRGERRGGPGRGMGEGAGAGLMKFGAANRLESLTPEQKTKLEALREKAQTEGAARRDEMRGSMEKVMKAGTPEERKTAMEELRAKRDEQEKAVDAELKAILTPEQLTQVDTQVKEQREKMRAEGGRRRGADDKATSGPADGKPRAKGEGRKEGKGEGRKGEGKKHKAKGEGKPGDKQTAPADAATTGTTPNPFAN